MRHLRHATYALLLLVGACDWGDRIVALEKNDALLREQQQSANHSINELKGNVERLRAETRGIGLRTVVVEPTNSMVTVFGNQAGHNAKVTMTNRGIGDRSAVVMVQTVRISRPGDRLPRDPNLPHVDPPIDTRTTEELDLSSVGASRQLMVPCGYQVLARASVRTTLNLRIEYDKAACAGQ
jgi:hypothetical protein